MRPLFAAISTCVPIHIDICVLAHSAETTSDLVKPSKIKNFA